MLRIAIDIRILGKKRTGDETVFFELTREVLKQDSQNEYFLLTNESDASALEILQKRLGLKKENPKQHLVVLPATNRFVWNGVTLPRYLKKAAIDVFHTQYILPFWLPKDLRVVNHIHDVSFCAYPKLISKKDLFFLNLLIPRSLKRSDAIVTPSAFTKAEIIKYYGVDDAKIHVIYNALGSDFETENVSTLSDDELRQKYQLPEQYLLYVGTLQPRKNIPFLLDALACLQKKLPATHLVLVGNRRGHHFDSEIDQKIKELHLENTVVFPGYVAAEDLPRIYQMASVFVFPSLYEGFGIPLLEAMSMGVPVVASNQACLREIGGDATLYFEQGQIDSLAELLYSLEVVGAQKQALIEKGKLRIKDFSWQKSGTKLIALYQS
ncbi:MAG: glycosyltransferase family 4 protein [Candidatus Moranbacteria bacterium]|nr:glycosyltransferase family 4 protein [Candidatus Moranbacteria bacterium]